MHSRLETVKYWAGQKLLHSPFHPYYLKLAGKQPKPQTYEEWLTAETAGPMGVAIPAAYKVVLPEGARLSADAGFWFAQAITATGAGLIYSDEDVIGPDGRRRDPVFKPAWSPELFAHCDYLGGAYVVREGVQPGSPGAVHIPRVLVHRASPQVYQARSAPIRKASSMVSIIICSRTPALAGECLEALRTTTAYEPYEMVLIDHRAGMTPLAERFGAKRISFEEDFNFARMCNMGARASHGDLLLFLNDDTAPLDRDWMGRMAGQAERQDTGAVGALLTYPDGRIQHAGVYIGTPNGAGHPGRLTQGSASWPWLRMTREQLAVTGACLMLRREVFEAVGNFDESFPVNYNDVDLCLKITGKEGLKVILEADARVEHRESTTRKTGIRYGERRRFLDRWASVIERGDPYFNPNLTDNEELLPDPEAFSRVGGWR